MKFSTNVLACTDLGRASADVVARAAMIVSSGGGRLGLVHVVKRGALDVLHDLLAPDNDGNLQAGLLMQAGEALDAIAQQLSDDCSIAVDPVVRVGSVMREILATAAEQQAGLLVLGDRGMGLLEELVLGSTVERLLSRSPCPIMVVKGPPAPVRRVLIPVDFSTCASAALALARKLAPDAEYVLLHAFSVPYEGKLRLAGVETGQVDQLRVNARSAALQAMDELIALGDLPEHQVRRVVRHGDAPRCIIEQERTLDCDLIVVGRQGRGRLEEVLVGSVTRHVLSFSRGDVLVAT